VSASAIAPSAAPLADRLTALLDAERERHGAPGMLALIHHGGDDLALRTGNADMAGTPITLDARFRVGSITKPIVAALVLLAVDGGLLSLDDDVSELLPDLVSADPPTTVRQLLDHTSGIFNAGDEGDPVADLERLTDPALREEARELLRRYLAGEEVRLSDRIWIALAETHDRYFEPGTGFHYSNVNYQMLGLILERTTGKPLAELLRSQIVEPLRLGSTSLAPADESTPEMHGFDARRQPGSLVDVTDDITWFGNGGNGGVISTADELLRIMQAIVTGRLLPAELASEMRTPHLASYGLGLATYELKCGTYYGHAGSVLGTQSIALVSADGADGVVIALNVVTDADAGLVALAEMLLCAR
jgi:D-alanyl-D-alanine carboxypeptidase